MFLVYWWLNFRFTTLDQNSFKPIQWDMQISDGSMTGLASESTSGYYSHIDLILPMNSVSLVLVNNLKLISLLFYSLTQHLQFSMILIQSTPLTHWTDMMIPNFKRSLEVLWMIHTDWIGVQPGPTRLRPSQTTEMPVTGELEWIYDILLCNKFGF